MTEFVPQERGTTIRYPSTALLCLDSIDKQTSDSVWNINIQKRTNLLSGFFTRIGITEVQLNWNVPNISSELANTTLVVDVSNSGINTYSATLPVGYYTVQQALDRIVLQLNTDLGSDQFYVDLSGVQFGQVGLWTKAGYEFRINFASSSYLPYQLGFDTVDDTYSSKKIIFSPDLRPFSYIDFVSSQLTYCQNLKDGSSTPQDVDVMCRLYFNWDGSYTSYDGYGLPILFGYKPDRLLRQFATPKMIKWDNIQPIGNLNIQIYGRRVFGDLLNVSVQPPRYVQITPYILSDFGTNYQMTLQVSEV